MTENPAPTYFNARRAFVSGTGAMLGAALLGVRSSRSQTAQLHGRQRRRCMTGPNSETVRGSQSAGDH
jgi:hypothetical protein